MGGAPTASGSIQEPAREGNTDGKLYLNLNPDVLELFNADFATRVTKVEKLWPDLAKKNGGRASS